VIHSTDKQILLSNNDDGAAFFLTGFKLQRRFNDSLTNLQVSSSRITLPHHIIQKFSFKIQFWKSVLALKI